MKKNHLEQIAANARVVRHVIDLLSELAPRASRSNVVAGIALVERWIAAEPVSVEELSEMASAIHSSAASFFQQDTQERAWGWGGTAVGNLCWMTTRKRGWIDGNRTVMDGAVSALTSLLPSGGEAEAHEQRIAEGLATRERLEAMRANALAELVGKSAAQPKPRVKRARTPRLVRPEGLSCLGKVVANWLERCRARTDPRATRDAATLRELAARKGHVVSDTLIEFEERYGGLVVSESPEREDRDFSFGAWFCLEHGLCDEFQAQGLVPVAASPNDLFYYLDTRGAAWAFDAIEDPEPVLYAPDAERMLARIALYNLSWHRRNHDQMHRVAGRQGQRIAEDLAIPLIPEASGEDDWRAWGDARRLVIEHVVDDEDDRKAETLVSGRGTKRFTNPDDT